MAAFLYLGVAVAGTAVALERGYRGRPLGITTDLDLLWDWVVGLSTALSAPLWVLLAFVATLVVARRRPASRGASAAVIAMGAAFIAGMLVEPITYRVLSPGGFDLIPTAFVAINLALPLLIVIFALQELPARPGTKRASAS